MVFILFFVSAPLLLAARVVQQLYMIDPLTGFYQDGFAGIGTAISALCFALIAVTLVMVWLSHPESPYVPKKSKPLAFAAFFAAGCLVISATGAVLSNGVSNLLIGVLGYFAAISIAWYGVSLVTAVEFSPLSTVLPVLYACLRLILSFVKYTREVAVTDSVFSIATMCLILLFFYSSGKLLSGVGGKRTHILFYSYGLCAAFFCADSALAHFILEVTGNNTVLHGGEAFDISYIGFAVYIVTAVWIMSDKAKRVSESNS